MSIIPSIHDILAGRSLEKADASARQVQAELPQSSSVITTVQIDIEDDKSISEAFDHVNKNYGRLDVLINNSGGRYYTLLEDKKANPYLGTQLDAEVNQGKMTMREMWNKSWDVNTTGTYILTHTFAPLLIKSTDPRLIFITSGTSTLAETEDIALAVNRSPVKGWPKPGLSIAAYRSSKTGMNMMMREWRRVLKEDGVKVWCISPGFLATGLGGNPEMLKKMGAIDPTIGANLVRSVVEGARDKEVGRIIRRNDIQPW
jgi:NAD(P)-dependent dehydrogenase (short-subunit alcohol dehydrogenase family)